MGVPADIYEDDMLRRKYRVLKQEQGVVDDEQYKR